MNAKYWQERYKNGGDSGAGSRGKLAHFKAHVVNMFIQEKNVKSVLDYGCGDGKQLELLKGYDSYTGIDVSFTQVKKLSNQYGLSKNKQFYYLDQDNLKDPTNEPLADAGKIQDLKEKEIDLLLSLDVVYHLTEFVDLQGYVNNIKAINPKFVILYTHSPRGKHRNYAKHIKYYDIKEVLRMFLPNYHFSGVVQNTLPKVNADDSKGSDCDFYFLYRTDVVKETESVERELVKESN